MAYTGERFWALGLEKLEVEGINMLESLRLLEYYARPCARPDNVLKC